MVWRPCTCIHTTTMAGPTMYLEERILVALYTGGVGLFCLYGMTIGQTVFYYFRYPDDSLRLKVYVAMLSMLDTAKSVAAACLLYYYIIECRADYGTLPVPVTDTLVNVCGWSLVFASQW
ncbi:uncharacterized protein B0H18DRAFT_211814 [Fomitopsis serialis]|uniref:uncharacterized protein n=1 Tax=Fomitopsis serialis TaxID=139415 RepID=UPI0020072801|nr:uncharacterized protein B0H18DRAFT_211814 [Neoantrodia serialis]KAH9929448.1 hypothetical protein B0H18DRAFT_211814 [Neoantrodia serialis]